MVCIYCESKTAVVNSRHQKRSNQVWRRRACVRCKAVFSTDELVNFERSVSVKYKNGILEPFSRDKLLISIHFACGHRKHPTADATALCATVINKLLPQIIQATIPKDNIINTVASALRRFDKAAAIQYLAYHPVNPK